MDFPTIIDHPKLRDSLICPTCGDPKDAGLLVCWDCYRELDFRNGMSRETAALLDLKERLQA